MTTIEALEIYMLAYINHNKKEIGFVGHAVAKGYGVPHPGTAVHPDYSGSLSDPQAYYMVDRNEYIIWSCEAIVLTFDAGTDLLMTYKNLGYNIKQVSVSELKRRNALYRQEVRENN